MHISKTRVLNLMTALYSFCILKDIFRSIFYLFWATHEI